MARAPSGTSCGATRPLALRDGAFQTVPVAMATAAAGIMIGIILQTGLAIRFTSFLVDFAGGSLIVALVITMIAAIILGTALPTTPAYIMLAALLIPALIKLGVPPMAAHMFAFYFGCLSAVTPPECLAVYAAASIARCGVWAAGWQAMKFAAAGFVVPYFFIYYPALLFQGPWGEIAQAVVTGSIGVVALAAGLEGYLLRSATWLERALLLAAALLLIDPQARDRPPRSRAARRGPGGAEAEAAGSGRRAGDAVSRAQHAALTLIAAALIVGTVIYGVLRLYAS